MKDPNAVHVTKPHRAWWYTGYVCTLGPQKKLRALGLAFSAVSCICYRLGTHMWLVTQIGQMTPDNRLSHSSKSLSEPKGYKFNCRKTQMIKNISD